MVDVWSGDVCMVDMVHVRVSRVGGREGLRIIGNVCAC